MSTASSQHFRLDIQALRGLAIALVLLHHARLFPPLKAGYLGVDVFFVVSGYLVTGIVQRALLDDTFSFAAFYARRAKRLLPAAYVTFVATAVASSLFLTQSEMRDFTAQLTGAVTFTGNLVLWRQTGYFQGAAQLKPLLHVWSLAIEEQYYLLLPALLVLTPRSLWRAGGLAATAASLVLCLALVTVRPGATFYLLPTRAWEMALGSTGVLVLEGAAAGIALSRFFWPALVALLAVPFFPTGAPHPGLDALIVCTATLIVILRRHPILNAGAPVIALAMVGDISYSLYLVHWPLFALAANAWVSPVPAAARLALTLCALLLSWALYRWVERPARMMVVPLNRRSLTATLVASASVVLLGYGLFHVQSSRNQIDYTFAHRANDGLNTTCEYSDAFTNARTCRTSDTPGIMVWGDSEAMHLVEGIHKSSAADIVQATRSRCGPLLGVSFFEADGFYNRLWSEKCVTFNDDVLAYLAGTPSVEVVVMSSFYAQYLPGSRLVVRDVVDTSAIAGSLTERPGSEDIAAESLTRTIAAVRHLGKRVILVAPPPTTPGVDLGRCTELKAEGRLFVGADNPSCAISEARYRNGRVPVQALLDRVGREGHVPVFHFDEFLCHDGICSVELDGVALYRDETHLSYDGSRLLGQKLNLGNRLMALAR